MISRLLFILFLLCTVGVSSPYSQTCDEFNKLVAAAYGFKPSKLTPDEQTQKSTQMDMVWQKVRTNQNDLLPCLRDAIKERSNDKFFAFDASSLLVSIYKSVESKKTLIQAYAAVDFADIDLRYWMPPIAALGFEGLDTTAAGRAWLNADDPKYYLTQHGTLAVTKSIGALVIYGSMDELVATAALVKIASKLDDPNRELALYILSKQVTPEAFAELKKLNRTGLLPAANKVIDNALGKPKLLEKRQGTSKTTRQQFLAALNELAEDKPENFMNLTTEVSDGERDMVAVLKEEDVPLIRKARRYFAATANPHSPEWYNTFTDIIVTLTWKPELKATEKEKPLSSNK